MVRDNNYNQLFYGICHFLYRLCLTCDLDCSNLGFTPTFQNLQLVASAFIKGKAKFVDSTVSRLVDSSKRLTQLLLLLRCVVNAASDCQLRELRYRAQSHRGRASDSRLRIEFAFESCAAVLKSWASFFTLHCSSSPGDYVYEQPFAH